MAHPFHATAPIVPTFNRAVHIVASNDAMTADAGALLVREIMDRLGITHSIASQLIDRRAPWRITHPLVEMIRTAVCLYAQGWSDLDDADALRSDPALRLAASIERGVRPLQPGNPLPSQPTLSRLIAALAEPEQLAALRRIIQDGVLARVAGSAGGQRLPLLELDVDSLPLEVHGRQAGSAYNGHYHCRMYHPMIATSAQLGDILDAVLRPGNAAAAEDAIGFILPLVRRLKTTIADQVLVRLDAGFPSEPLFAALDAEEVLYVARLKSNPALDRRAGPFVGRAPGRPPQQPRLWFHEMTYQAGSWSRPRRLVLVVKERLGELINDWFWVVTNVPAESRDGAGLLDDYRRRGTAEGHIGEFKDVLAPALSAAGRPRRRQGAIAVSASEGVESAAFGRNFAILLLNVLAYNVLHAGRVVAETATGRGMSLRRFRQAALKVAGRVVQTGRRLVLRIQGHAVDLWRSVFAGLARHLPLAA